MPPRISASGDEAERESVRRERTPSPGAAQRASVTRMYAQAIAEKTNQNGNGSESPSSARRKPNKNVAALYQEQIAKASPPASPKVSGRSRPAKDITQLYTDKLEAGPVNGAAAAGAEKVSPRKVKCRGSCPAQRPEDCIRGRQK